MGERACLNPLGEIDVRTFQKLKEYGAKEYGAKEQKNDWEWGRKWLCLLRGWEALVRICGLS